MFLEVYIMKSWYIIAQETEYRGNHTPAIREKGSSLDDMSDVYPDDIYSGMGARYYGDSLPYDNESISIISYCRGRPNRSVKIYRAVPDFNYDINEEIKTYQKLLSYYNQFEFFPMSNEIVDRFGEKYGDVNRDQDLFLKIYEDIRLEIKNLQNQLQSKLQINAGDWVTISRLYAKAHGETQFNRKYKILTKTVKASDLYTSGDSIHEWGYQP